MDNSQPPISTILIPVYNDWDSFWRLVQALDAEAAHHDYRINIVAVNDASLQINPNPTLHVSATIETIRCFHLVRNLGHQRAIAVGLVTLAQEQLAQSVIVMDADGEDQPTDIQRLLQVHTANPQQIIVAQRKHRSEGRSFRLFYNLYKGIFYWLTGQRIDFGNFCLIPAQHLNNLVHDPHLWNHFAGTIKHSKIPLLKVPTERGKRYLGKSKMNFIALVLHGLSAMSVFLDIIVVRVLVVSSAVTAVALMGIGIVVFLRMFTTLAIPGWATSAVGLLLIIIFQMMSFSAGAAFSIVHLRSHKPFTPALDAPPLLSHREVLHSQKSERMN